MHLKTAAKPLLLTLTASLAIPTSANVWYTFTVHSDDACSTKPRAFFYSDMTAYAQMLAADANLTQQQVTSVDAAANATTCADYIAAHKAFPDLIYDVKKTYPYQTNLSIPAEMVTDNLLSSSMVDMKYIVKKLDDVQAGHCIPSNQTELIPETNVGYVQTGCIILTDTVPPPPKSQDLWGVQAWAPSAGDTNCLQKSIVMVGNVADGQCKPESGFNQDGQRVCLRVTCDDFSPGATAIINGVETSATRVAPDHYNRCFGSEGDGPKLLFQCQAGTGAAGGGWSPVKGETSVSHDFVQGETTAVSLDGNVDLNLQPATAGAVAVNVTVAPRPTVADEAPESGINAFWHFSANGSFSAKLKWTFDDEILNKFNYTAEELRWARYNEATGVWEVKNETVVDVVNQSVMMTTGGFSEWTIVAAGTTSGAFLIIPSSVAVLGFLILSLSVVGF